MKKFLPLLLVPAAYALADGDCTPKQPTACNLDSCTPCYCLGPTDPIANAPVRPYTCDGDLEFTAAALYWKATQDGMEYAVLRQSTINPGSNLIDGEYLTPEHRYNFGYRFGVGYNSPCDGWDVDLLWTHLNSHASSSVDLQPFEQDFIPLWSALSPAVDGFPIILNGTRTDTIWSVSLDLIDLQLGREYWVSKSVSLRPFMGLRGASLRQKYQIEYRGENFFTEFELPVNCEVRLKNDFEGVGALAGLDMGFHLRCGWSLFGDLAASILYGNFTVDHEENARGASAPFPKAPILDTKNHFRASRAVLDLALGIQWHALLCECKYGFSGLLTWEDHLFFHQNQMWRVERKQADAGLNVSFPNNNGQNDLNQRRGTFATGGLTLTFKFDF